MLTLRFFFIALIICAFCAGSVSGQEPDTAAAPAPAVESPPPTAAPAAPTSEAAPSETAAAEGDRPLWTAIGTQSGAAGEIPDRMTLGMMVQQGGTFLWVLLLIAFLTFIWALYLVLTLTVGREVPQNLAKRAQAQIRAGDLRGAYQMCLERDELLARVLRAGLKVAGRDRYVIQEAMEGEGSRGAAQLWQRISYLHNAANLAPLIGLLGSVWGMMLAFGAIAYDSPEIKELTIASAVALAMINAAAGLAIAIPALAGYYFLRRRVVLIVGAVEAQASDFLEYITAATPE